MMSDNKWFRVEPWKSNSMIGYCPRVKEIKANVDELPYYVFPETEIITEEIIFDERSILTDAVFENANKNGSMWVVSNKLKTILQSFALPSHAFYSIPTTTMGSVHVDVGFNLFMIFEDKDIDVNYQESSFKTVSYTNFLRKDSSKNIIPISSYEDYIKKRRVQSDLLKDIHPVTLVLNKPIKEDLFALRAAKYFVSKNLAKELEKEGVSGFDLIPIDFEIVEE